MATRCFHWDVVDDCVLHETDGGGNTLVAYTRESGVVEAMKFHSAILRPDGAVVDKRCRDSEEIRSHAFGARMMEDVARLLHENLGDDPVSAGKFRVKVGDDSRHNLEWQQPHPLSGMGRFFVGSHVAAVSFCLHGFIPEFDEAVVTATEALWAGMEKAGDLCRGLRSIRERPVMIVLPNGKADMSPRDWRIIENLCICFAAMFFERAEAAIQQIEAYWHQRGFRKGGKETDFLWN